MNQVKLIHGETPEEFVEAYNAFCATVQSFEGRETIDNTTCYVFYEEETEPEPEQPRRCCECNNYDWGKGCEFCDGVIRPMREACEWFNAEVPNEEVQS